MKLKLPKALIVDTYDATGQPWRTMETYLHPEWKNIKTGVIEMDQLKRWRKGIYRAFSSNPKELIEKIDRSKVKNVCIVFEDATKYIYGKLSESVKNLVYDSKQRNLNIIFYYHSLAAVPLDLVRIADFLVLHKTGDNIKNVKGRYPIDDLEEVFEFLKASDNQYERVLIPLN
ncbi:MAG: hypothetical protein MK066_13545 [Crocinitomicaceae bacterium]|nr:hypothetical protein [Crocinitomicaceae bacterium]